MGRRQTNNRSHGPRRGASKPDGESIQNEKLALLYDDLVRSRDRLADLPPVTGPDIDRLHLALHEVIFHLLTPPLHLASDLPISSGGRSALIAAARDRSLDPFTGLVALVAQKLALAQSASRSRSDAAAILRDALDVLTFDYHTPKKDILALLRDVRHELDSRLAYVKGIRPTGYRFTERPELYRDRAHKTERPDQFFERVYRGHVRRGLTQADIRLADPGYYNVLHVWCTRHHKKLAALVPASRRRG